MLWSAFEYDLCGRCGKEIVYPHDVPIEGRIEILCDDCYEQEADELAKASKGAA